MKKSAFQDTKKKFTARRERERNKLLGKSCGEPREENMKKRDRTFSVTSSSFMLIYIFKLPKPTTALLSFLTVIIILYSPRYSKPFTACRTQSFSPPFPVSLQLSLSNKAIKKLKHFSKKKSGLKYSTTHCNRKLSPTHEVQVL